MMPCTRPAPRSRKASCRAAALRFCAPPRRSRRSVPTTTTRRPGSRSCARRSPGRRARSPSTPARTAPGSWARSWSRISTASASTPSPASTATWCRKASSIRPRWFAPRCRTRPPWPACSSPPRRWSPRCRRSRRLPCRRAPAEWAAEWTSKENATAIVRSCPGSLAKLRGFPDFLYLRVRGRPLLSGLETWVCKRDRRREISYPRRGVHMSRGIYRLSGADLRRSKPGLFGDGNGLWLQVNVAKNGKRFNRSWIFRYTTNGRTTEMGLGSLDVVGLKEAREQAREYCALRLRGVDPLQHRNAQRAAVVAADMKSTTFEAAAHAYIGAHRNEWRSQKHAHEWPRSLIKHVFPTLGPSPVSTIDTALVVKALEKVWQSAPETAARLRGRIEAILDWSTVAGYRSGDNPARW